MTVRVAESDTDFAVFRPSWSAGGTLELPDGRALRLASANFWQSEWVWSEKDQPLARFKGRHGLIKANGAVELMPGATDLPELAMLVLLGWYLILLYADDVAGANTASTVAVISS